MSMRSFDEKIKKVLKKDDSERSNYFDFDFDKVTFMGKNMALRNKTSNKIFGNKKQKVKEVEENEFDE